MGNISLRNGNHIAAESRYKRALAIREKSLGPDHPDVVFVLSNLAVLYEAIGNFAEAEPLLKRALAIKEKSLGAEHPDVAEYLQYMAAFYYLTSNFAEVGPLFKRALAIKEKSLGPEHPDISKNLDTLAGIYWQTSNFAEAEPLFKRALVIKEKALGPEHLDVALSLNFLATLYQTIGNYTDAVPLLMRALAIREKSLGPEHPEVAKNLQYMAELTEIIGNFSEVEPLLKRALAINEKSLGPGHLDVAINLNNLATLYQTIGNFAEAEPLLKRALAIRETLGPDHLDCLVLHNSAILYEAMGNFAEAEPLFKRSLAINEKSLGPDHPDVAKGLNNLAVLYKAIGNFAEAELLFKRALAINEKSLGPDHPDVAGGLFNLASLYQDKNNYVEAGALFKRALAINEKSLGPDHPDVAMCLNSSAAFYQAIGNYLEVESLCKRALAIREKSLGPDHPDVASVLMTLAQFYQAIGNFTEAEPLFKRALAIFEKTLGPDHPKVATSLNTLAILYIFKSLFWAAIPLFKREQIVTEKLIEQVLGFTSERQKLEFISSKHLALAIFLSIVSFHMHDDLSAKKDSLNFWLRRKGVVLESQRRFQEVLFYGNDAETLDVIKQLSRTRVEISRLYFTETEADAFDKIKQKIISLEKQRSELDARLNKLCQPYAEKQKIRQKASVNSIAQNLPPCSALLEFIRLLKIEIPLPKGQEKFVNHDVVFIVYPNENIEIVDLGPSDAVDYAVNSLKKVISSGKTDTKNLATISRKLHDLVFAKIKEKIGNTRELFISPDGNLSLIPFEVLQDENGRFLIEDYTFNYLSSGRDILGFGQVFERSNKALIVGDPDFEKDTTPTKENDKTQRAVELEMKVFSSLPGTRKEIEDIANIIGRENAVVYSGKQATEEALFSFHNPALLHLATHGFFKADQPNDVDYSPSMMRDFTFVTPGQMIISSKKIVTDNPLLRSGLVLAGANRAIRGESKSDEGILTADKILNLRLWGTKLVVLSACETGMGDVRSGEGVFGLRRAFNQVGAKSLVMSMWKVPDTETQELMVNFYRNIYERHMNYNQALRQATLTQLQTVKTRYGHANPYYWGAFVFSGDPNR
ncbi:MAG: CHAT domain-containing tetratricopeptide repeat protein [Deltaproteobacteria bacterium]